MNKPILNAFMKYKDAKELREGDHITRKDDKAILVVKEVIAFGQYKTVKIACYNDNYNEDLRSYIYIYNSEIE